MWTGLRQLLYQRKGAKRSWNWRFKTCKKENLLFSLTLYHEDVQNGMVIKILNAVS